MPTREAPPPAVRANSFGDHSSSSPVSRSSVTTRVMRAGTTISDRSDTRESGMAVYISISQYSADASSGKQYSQRSPGSAEAITGWLLDRACLLACRLGDESQQRVPPQVWHV